MSEAVPVLAAQHREQQDALTAIGAEHLRQARLNTELDGAWSPLVILADSAFTAGASGDEAALNDLVRMVSNGPKAAAAVVTSGTPITEDEAQQPDGVWVLSTDPGAAVTVPGTDLTLIVEPLTDEDYADLTEITATSLSETDVPALPRRLPRRCLRRPSSSRRRTPRSTREWERSSSQSPWRRRWKRLPGRTCSAAWPPTPMNRRAPFPKRPPSQVRLRRSRLRRTSSSRSRSSRPPSRRLSPTTRPMFL